MAIECWTGGRTTPAEVQRALAEFSRTSGLKVVQEQVRVRVRRDCPPGAIYIVDPEYVTGLGQFEE